MKILPLLLAALLPLSTFSATTDSSDPEIMQVSGKLVTVRVPKKFDRVTLQMRVSPPKGHAATAPAAQPVWKTVSIKFMAGKARDVGFKLPQLVGRRNLRVIGEQADALSGDLLTGFTQYGADPVATAANGIGVEGGNGSALTNVSGSKVLNFSTDSTSGAAASTRDVVESDIWKLQGDRLWFFNERRGLQVFDVSQPDDPALLGTLRMPAVGDDMYVLDADHAALLKRSNTWFPILYLDGVNPVGTFTLAADASLVKSAAITLSPQQKAAQPSEVVLTELREGHPEILARVPFTGTLRESRMVGKVLYVASDVYTNWTDTVPAQWGLQLTSFDLSDPAHPVQRATLNLGGWANAVYATDRYFFAAKWSGNTGSSVDIIDISDASGAMTQAAQVQVEGNVADKFKLHIDGNVLTVVSEKWVSATANNSGQTTTVTKVNTFSLAEVAKPAALGHLELARGETLYATRFDGSRLYVVTATRVANPVDPLWIVDLSTPANPRVLGELEIPGFSTYVAPLGDRLVSIGLVNWQPAISLFDVSNPAKPALLTRLSLAAVNGWSYTEATWSEKAFNVLPEDNLILLPLSGYDETSGESNGVQIIDLFSDKLVKRGLIPTSLAPRRATLHRDRILSLSATHLVSVDARDRDKPVVKADLEIAWTVDRVFAVGDYLVEIGRDGWNANDPTTFNVALAANPDASLGAVSLTGGYVVGTALREGVLHVLQYRGSWEAGTGKASATLSTIDVSRLPAIVILGEKSVPLPDDSWDWSNEAKALWPLPTTLVWGQQLYSGSWWRALSVATNAANQQAQWFSSTTERLVAFDVTRPETPQFVSTQEVGAKRAWEVSEPFATEGLIYISHKELGRDLLPDSSWPNAAHVTAPVANDALRNRHFLQLLEYGGSNAQPVIRPAQTNIPGRLVGLAQSGKLLLTRGQGYDLGTFAPQPSSTVLHTSAFDGTDAHLLDILPLPAAASPFTLAGHTLFVLKAEPAQIWKPGPISIDDPAVDALPLRSTSAIASTSVLISRIAPGWWWGSYAINPNLSELRTYSITPEGKFAPLGTLALKHETSVHLFGDLLAAQDDLRSVRLIDVSQLDAPADLGAHQFDGWVWPNLEAADGSLTRGLSVPLGQYGIETIALPLVQ